MLEETKKTHVLVTEPRISVRRLADYMAASHQSKRTIIQSCKYRAIARVFQHNEAMAIVTNHILSDAKGAGDLKSKAEFIRNKVADNDFDEDTNEHNADYVERFAEIVADVALPDVEMATPKEFAPLNLRGVKVSFRPRILFSRTTKTNKVRCGALMLRYSKGKPLPINVAEWQSAAIFGCMRMLNAINMAEAERSLCITLDAYTGKCHEAPGKAVYLFNEMTAACATIGKQWREIKPPKNAIL